MSAYSLHAWSADFDFRRFVAGNYCGFDSHQNSFGHPNVHAAFFSSNTELTRVISVNRGIVNQHRRDQLGLCESCRDAVSAIIGQRRNITQAVEGWLQFNDLLEYVGRIAVMIGTAWSFGGHLKPLLGSSQFRLRFQKRWRQLRSRQTCFYQFFASFLSNTRERDVESHAGCSDCSYRAENAPKVWCAAASKLVPAHLPEKQKRHNDATTKNPFPYSDVPHLIPDFSMSRGILTRLRAVQDAVALLNANFRIPKMKTMDLRTFEPRLENWARAQRSSGYQPATACSAEGMYRGGRRELMPAALDIDQADAHLVNEAWKRLMPLDKDVLMLHYVWRAPSSFICRRLKIKQGRGKEHVWEFALFHAQSSISARLEKVCNIENPIRAAYTIGQLITDSVD